MLEISLSSFPPSDSAKCSAVWYRLKRVSVTLFTLVSGHCAERMVAISSSKGFLKRRAIAGSGYFLNSLVIMFFAEVLASGIIKIISQELSRLLCGRAELQGKRTIWQSGILHVMPEGFNRA